MSDPTEQFQPTPVGGDAPATQPAAAAAEPSESPVAAAASVDLDRVGADLAGVEAALERLDAGTYGQCAVCDTPIADADLAADPTRLTCAAHA